jgi:hypothetical protein
VYKGRVHKLKPDQANALCQAWVEGNTLLKLLGKAFGISRQAVYRYLKDISLEKVLGSFKMMLSNV